MKRHILCAACSLLALPMLVACGDGEDDLEASIDFTSPYVITDNLADSIQHAVYLLYEEYGVPIYFNDTIATYVSGRDLQGGDVMRTETIDLNWNFQSHTYRKVNYAFDYLTTDAQKSRALLFARDYLGRASAKMRPFCLLLVDSLHIDGDATTLYYNGFRSLVVAQLTDITADERTARSTAILRDMVLSRVEVNTELVDRFGAVSSKDKYYGRPWVNDGANGGLGCVWGVEHNYLFWRPQRLWGDSVAQEYIDYSYATNVSTVEEFEAERALIFRQIGRYGFICGNTTYNDQTAHLESPANVSQDLTYFVTQMLSLGETEFMNRYGASSMVKKKYDILADYIEGELDINLDF